MGVLGILYVDSNMLYIVHISVEYVLRLFIGIFYALALCQYGLLQGVPPEYRKSFPV